MAVLIVDDSQIVSFVLEKHIKNINKNIKIFKTTDGADAIDIVRKDIDKFSLIFMDIQMVNVDGIEATKKIKELNYNGHIVGISCINDTKTHQECIEAGMDTFVNKPFNVADIKDVLDKFFIESTN